MCIGNTKHRRDCRTNFKSDYVRRLMYDYDLHVIISQTADDDDVNDTSEFYQVFTVGDLGDSSVAIHDLLVAPWYRSMEKLEAFLVGHMMEIRDALYAGENGDWDKMNILREIYCV